MFSLLCLDYISVVLVTRPVLTWIYTILYLTLQYLTSLSLTADILDLQVRLNALTKSMDVVESDSFEARIAYLEKKLEELNSTSTAGNSTLHTSSA